MGEENGVDEAEELHDSLVLPQVLVALEQELEFITVAACGGWWMVIGGWRWLKDGGW